MTPAFWLLHAGLTPLMRALAVAGRVIARGADRLRRRHRRRRPTRIYRVTDARLLEDIGISRDVLEIFWEPSARCDGSTGLRFPPTNRPARHHY